MQRPLLLLVCVASIAASSAACRACPRPGFAGVPESGKRSADFALPLTEPQAEVLIAYLSDPDAPRGRPIGDFDADAMRAAATAYAPLIAHLKHSKPAAADFAPGGAWEHDFEPPLWPLRISDARIAGFGVDTSRVRGYFSGGFVFAFYWRKLVETPGAGGMAWSLDPGADGVFSGLVVFRRAFAEATAAP